MPWCRVMRRARFKKDGGALDSGACDPGRPGRSRGRRLGTQPKPSIGPQRASLRAHRHGSTSSRTWQKTYRLTLPSAPPERRPVRRDNPWRWLRRTPASRGHGWPWMRAVRAHRHGSTSSRTWQKTYRLTLPSAIFYTISRTDDRSQPVTTRPCRGRRVPSPWCSVPRPSRPSDGPSRPANWPRSGAPAACWACRPARGTCRRAAP
jgi:hypothetical protein